MGAPGSPFPSAENEAVLEVSHPVVSPVTGEVLENIALTTREGVAQALRSLPDGAAALSPREVFAFLHRLREQLLLRREQLFQMTVLETGFIAADSREIVDGAIEFLGDFETYVRKLVPRSQIIRHSYSSGSSREMRITHRPLRAVAAVVPQNASLTLAVTVMASALYAGTRIVLRPSLQGGVTGALLMEAVRESSPPESSILIMNCLASDFLDACCASDKVELIHHIGSNAHALNVFQQAFAAGKTCLIDGQGHGLLYVDDGYPLPEAVALITSAATRYNGETCTSTNGVLIHEAIYREMKEALVESFGRLRIGHPLSADARIGPLFSEKQALRLQTTLNEVPGGLLLCGGHRRGAYFAPAVLEGVTKEDMIVRQGFFGPAIWIRSIKEDEVADWLQVNQYPLCDTVLSLRRPVVRQVAVSSRAARICVNEDPSVESMFEPWGGYPPSGLNPVSIWTEKYRQCYQLDGRLKEILAVDSEP